MTLDISDAFLIVGIMLISVSLWLWWPGIVPAYYGVVALLYGLARGIADARQTGTGVDQPSKR